ncbi:SRPBCC family protein [Hymenobacter cellulosilyticus]|uniref:SRPBCC family protein n=1 Tax=Hymenobacter cellulosilyticus TaxID=2932248 RepID=UPI0028808B4C|nr:SRPBCC domain-containing protein [Hymenobacter cellulosilyticus]
MEPKTRISAEDNRQDLLITRTFDLPLPLLFTAYTDPAIIEQWMGTKVLKLDNQKHGSWQLETTDEQGQVVFRAGGVIHDFIPDQKITRTFEIENAPSGPSWNFWSSKACPTTPAGSACTSSTARWRSETNSCSCPLPRALIAPTTACRISSAN